MITIYTGKSFILEFDSTGKQVELNMEETQEFEKWVLKTIKNQMELDADKEIQEYYDGFDNSLEFAGDK